MLNPTGYGGQAEGGTPLDFIVPDGEDGFTGMFVRQADHGAGDGRGDRRHGRLGPDGQQGIAKDTKVCMKAYGIQMVYVAEGPFYLGSGGDETGSFYEYPHEMKANEVGVRMITNAVSTTATSLMNRAPRQVLQPYRVTNSAAIPTGKKPGMLWARGAEPEDGGEIPATFPNGYAAFYLMAERISASQYACFLNTLTPEEADKHYHDGQFSGQWLRRVAGGPGLHLSRRAR